MSISIYDRRNMIMALHQSFSPRTFLARTFFNFENPIQHDGEKIDIEIKKTKRRIAEWQSHKLPGKAVEKQNYKTLTYTPGYLKPKKVTTVDDVLIKPFGGANIYGPHESPAARAQMKLGEDLAELRDVIVRRVEQMAADVLEDGVVTISGDGIEDYTIDFQMLSDHIKTLKGTDLWNDAASDPIALFRSWKREIAKDSGVNANIAVHGQDAWDAFIANTKVKEYMDNRRIELGRIAPQDRGDGATYQATIEGIEHWTYDEWYYDRGTAANKVMVPEKKVFLGSTMAYTGVHFGAIKDLESDGKPTVNQVNYFPKTWPQEDPSVRFLLLQSAPMVCMHQSDAFITVKVLS